MNDKIEPNPTAVSDNFPNRVEKFNDHLRLALHADIDRSDEVVFAQLVSTIIGSIVIAEGDVRTGVAVFMKNLPAAIDQAARGFDTETNIEIEEITEEDLAHMVTKRTMKDLM